MIHASASIDSETCSVLSHRRQSTAPRNGGRTCRWETLMEIRRLTAESGARLHMDGARLFEAHSFCSDRLRSSSITMVHAGDLFQSWNLAKKKSPPLYSPQIRDRGPRAPQKEQTETPPQCSRRHPDDQHDPAATVALRPGHLINASGLVFMAVRALTINQSAPNS